MQPVCAKKEKAGAAHAPAAKVPEEHTSPALCGNITETSNNNNIESGQNDREVVINSSGDPIVLLIRIKNKKRNCIDLERRRRVGLLRLIFVL